MAIRIRQALAGEAGVVEEILLEAAAWVELDAACIAAEVDAGQFFIADVDGDAAGVIRFQLEDLLFWPDLPQSESAFVHRLAVRRRYRGQGVSDALLEWSIERARTLGKRHLRLDCDESRPKLRALYERIGFCFHSFRQVGAYYVARYEYPL
jgi:GNAT superfamily N-acetyltransferase